MILDNNIAVLRKAINGKPSYTKKVLAKMTTLDELIRALQE
jgi:hypothetical protein